MLPSALVVEVGQLLEAGEPFVYAYYDGIDKIAHGHGFGPYYDAELTAADRLVADLAARLPAGAVLVVTADHGQVEVGRAIRILDPGADGRHGAGQRRGPFPLAPRPAGDRVDALAARARETYGDEAWVWTADELDRRRVLRRSAQCRGAGPAG